MKRGVCRRAAGPLAVALVTMTMACGGSTPKPLPGGPPPEYEAPRAFTPGSQPDAVSKEAIPEPPQTPDPSQAAPPSPDPAKPGEPPQR